MVLIVRAFPARRKGACPTYRGDTSPRGLKTVGNACAEGVVCEFRT